MGIKIDPKKPKTFVVRFSKRHPITKKVIGLQRKGIKTKAEANRVYAELVVKVEDRIRRQNFPNWETMLERFYVYALEKGLQTKTVHNYQVCLEAHTLPDWLGRSIDSISPLEIRQLVEKKVGHRSPSHKQSLLKFIRAVFNYAVEDKILSQNPTPEMKFKVGDKVKRVLTEKETKRFLQQAQELDVEWFPIWATALYTGMRSGELISLTWDNVDLENRKIFVKHSWNNKDGLKSTKSGDDRVIVIAQPLLTLLKKLRSENHDSIYVLPQLEKWKKGDQARELRLFLAGMGLPMIRFHDLRATWATMLLSKGVEPIKVMKMGGWKDIKTMMIYARKAGVDIENATDCLELHNPYGNRGSVVEMNQFSRIN